MARGGYALAMAEDWIRIASDTLSAEINPFGAELSSLRDAAGRELMTDADPAFWTGRAPLLFPIVGALNGGAYRVNGREYRLPKHGFARTLPFELVVRDADRAVFRLVDGPETRPAFPFAFTLDIAFQVTGGDQPSLAVTATVTNRGQEDMPASFGFHPAFAWPLPYGGERADHAIAFAQGDADMPIRRIGADGLIAPDPRPSPLAGDPPTLTLRDDLFEDDALIWPEIGSRSLRYGDGAHSLAVDFPDMPMLGIWTKPGARYVCIEPWHGIADPEGFTGDIWEKPGILRFAPGQSRSFAMGVTLRI